MTDYSERLRIAMDKIDALRTVLPVTRRTVSNWRNGTYPPPEAVVLWAELLARGIGVFLDAHPVPLKPRAGRRGRPKR